MKLVKSDADMENHPSVINANQTGVAKTYLALVSNDSVDMDHLRDTFLSRGFEVDTAASAYELLALQANRFYDVVILDANIPGDDVIVTLRRLTRKTPLSAAIVRSDFSDELDRIIALEVGADDCINKSCHPREVLARVHAVLRRISIHREINVGVSFQKLIFKSEFRFL